MNLFGRIFFLAGILVLVISAGTCMSAPVAVIDQPDYDFGTILESKVLIHEFEVRNTGDAELKIIKVKTG